MDPTPTTIESEKCHAKSRSIALPSVNLRKRAASGEGTQELLLPTVNSDLLCGLFADAAQSNINDQDSLNKNGDIHSPRLLLKPPTKKTRVTTKVEKMGRCKRSFLNLPSIKSPTGAAEIFEMPDALSAPKPPIVTDVFSQDPATYQLKFISADSSSGMKNTAELGFPKLAPIVSNGSCSTALTRHLSDLQTTLAEDEGSNNNSGNKYGWFVEMDSGACFHEPSIANPYSSSTNLAFQAPTAPNASGSHDSEVEWAKAADTVDDVLGDIFF